MVVPRIPTMTYQYSRLHCSCGTTVARAISAHGSATSSAVMA